LCPDVHAEKANYEGAAVMPRIDESVFNDQMRGLLVARGGYTSEKKKEEIKRYWYLEFRDCDEQAFIQVMGKLKFGGKSGEGFPSFRDFRDEYKILIKPQDRDMSRGYCGLCNFGRVFYRGLHQKTGEVHDYVADCAQCTENSDSKVNPRELHKDRIGQLRTFGALQIDRIPQEVKRPEWIFAKFPKLKAEKVYFLGLSAINDPDMEITYQIPAQKPSNGKEIAEKLFGKSDAKTEVKREISLEQDRKEEEFPNVPY